MAITVKKTALWRKELENQPGTLATALQPLAETGADLQLVMLYRFPGTHQGAIEMHPISEEGRQGSLAALASVPRLFPCFWLRVTIVPGSVTPWPKRSATRGLTSASLWLRWSAEGTLQCSVSRTMRTR